MHCTVTAADFKHAWDDLYTRLVRAEGHLGDLAVSATANPADQERLTGKQHAIRSAIALWEDINSALDPDSAGHPAAWHGYTDQVARMFEAPGMHAGFYDGVSLALSYQRGYGAGIDAPVIINPHLPKER